jgi:hypothetical protein
MAFKARFSRREDGGYDAFYGKGSKKLTAVIAQDQGKWKVSEGFAAGKVPAAKKLGDVKEGWAGLAEQAYGTNSEAGTPAVTLPGPPRLGPPPPPLRPKEKIDLSQIPPTKGPPSLRMAQGIDPCSFTRTGSDDEGRGVYEGRSFADEMEAFMARPDVPKAEKGAATCPHCRQPFTGWRKEGNNYLPPCRCNHPNSDDYSPDLFDPRMWGMDTDNRFREITPVGVLDMIYHWMLRNREYVTTDGKLDPLWQEVQRVLWRNTGYAEYRPERWEGNQP